ncbi:hypothetical protein [Rudaeicoccus suwonensis]|uniref:Uncharacterized protein n=1 Tax=Rudaeicoccus suwonensis TaxID=657409 RepID=A0A561EAE0_9MICO|nr:hypothetical protein [Rudaeicoccus suwonensis]TWE12575.1 hypothetical protein BKA23_1388 [Rudaeicoccus suwonensis]
MSGDRDPSKLLDRIVSCCFAVLLGAIALYGAVRLIAAVFLPLCIGVCAMLAMIGVWLLVRRGRGW